MRFQQFLECARSSCAWSERMWLEEQRMQALLSRSNVYGPPGHLMTHLPFHPGCFCIAGSCFLGFAAPWQQARKTDGWFEAEQREDFFHLACAQYGWWGG